MPEADATYSIGEVINLLHDEFPELSVSKVRFLEGQGLIEPQRSESGYRMFSHGDLERIRYILREQRDNYLPLKVIKTRLGSLERGEVPERRRSAAVPADSYFAGTSVSMSPDELARAAGLTTNQLTALTADGILEPVTLPDGSLVHQEEDLPIAIAARRLLGEGLEPRHLRTIRLGADREVDLLQQLVTPMLRHRSPERRRQAAQILAETAQAGAQLREGIVRARLRRLLEG